MRHVWRLIDGRAESRFQMVGFSAPFGQVCRHNGPANDWRQSRVSTQSCQRNGGLLLRPTERDASARDKISASN